MAGIDSAKVTFLAKADFTKQEIVFFFVKPGKYVLTLAAGGQQATTTFIVKAPTGTLTGTTSDVIICKYDSGQLGLALEGGAGSPLCPGEAPHWKHGIDFKASTTSPAGDAALLKGEVNFTQILPIDDVEYVGQVNNKPATATCTSPPGADPGAFYDDENDAEGTAFTSNDGPVAPLETEVGAKKGGWM